MHQYTESSCTRTDPVHKSETHTLPRLTRLDSRHRGHIYSAHSRTSHSGTRMPMVRTCVRHTGQGSHPTRRHSRFRYHTCAATRCSAHWSRRNGSLCSCWDMEHTSCRRCLVEWLMHHCMHSQRHHSGQGGKCRNSHHCCCHKDWCLAKKREVLQAYFR